MACFINVSNGFISGLRCVLGVSSSVIIQQQDFGPPSWIDGTALKVRGTIQYAGFKAQQPSFFFT